MSRAVLASSTLAMLAVLPLVPVAVAAPGVVPAAALCVNDRGTDYDFRDLGSDVAVGVPGEDIGAARDAGAVEVRYGCDSTAPQGLRLPHPRSGDRFGAAMAGGTYSEESHGVEALFVGVPDLDVRGHKNAGGVAEFHGSSTGLHFYKLWTQASTGMPGRVQSGAHFGASLRMFNNDDENFGLIIGEPGRDVGRVKDTGGVVTLNWSAEGDRIPPNVEITVADIGFHAHSGDLFGSSLSTSGDYLSGLDVGAPGRIVHGHRGAGAVFESDPSRSSWTQVTQDTAGISSAAETGDHFGASLSDQWIGVPDEAVGRVAHAGVVQYYDPNDSSGTGDPSLSQTLDQNSPGVSGSVGSQHRFGSALLHQHGLEDPTAGGTLYVGAPGDRGGDGSVSSLRLGDGPLFTGGGGEVALPDPLPAGSHFGAAVAGIGGHGVAVGGPRGGGGHVVTYLQPAEELVQDASWVQVTGKPEAGDGYGQTLCAQQDEGYVG